MLGGRAPRPDREPYTRRAMADKVEKPKKKAKPKKEDKGVLAALPATRPEPIGTRRARTPAPAKASTAANGAKRTRTKRATAKPASSPAPTRATTARPKAVAPPEPVATPPDPRPRAVSEGAPGIGTHAHPDDERSPESARPSGVELASTAVKAVGEVAQLGLSVGGHMLKRVVDRLPRP
jgi:hypothetical protein